jgi:hypothetical protein
VDFFCRTKPHLLLRDIVEIVIIHYLVFVVFVRILVFGMKPYWSIFASIFGLGNAPRGRCLVS